MTSDGSVATEPAVWGVRPLVPATCAVLAAGFAAWLAIAENPADRLVAGACGFGSVVAGLLLLTMRRRLTADRAGFTVRGPGGARQFRWHQVTAISAPTRRRRGLASTSVELDLDDDGLILLGKVELGTDPVLVAQTLRSWWRPGPPVQQSMY